jgi:type II secretory pathway pseudopilin PulG
MTEPTVPPESPIPPQVPPTTPPPSSDTAWIKYVLIGCGGLALLAIVVVVMAIAGAIAIPNLRKAQEQARVAEAGGQVHRGTLGPGDPMASDGSWYEAYPISVGIGDHFVITMRSSDFDAYLTLVAPDGGVVSDDDSGGGTDSRIDVTFDEVGTREVRANTLRPGATGDYTLTIERVP